MQAFLRKFHVSAPLPLQQATARCALCAAAYWVARLVLDSAFGALLALWVGGPGVGAPPAVWQAVQWSGSLVSGALALLAPVLLAVRLWPDKVSVRIKPLRSSLLWWALPVYMGGAQLFSLLAGAVGETTGSSQQVALPDTLPALVLAFLALCVLPAVLEELLFRGVAQGLVRPYGAWAAVTAQAVLFALLHNSVSGVIYALPAGLFFGLLAEQTGSILPGMLLHLCNNLLSFLLVLLQGAGYSGLASLFSTVCLVVFPLWAAAAMLRARKYKRPLWRPLKPGASPAALLDCREWRFTVLVLLAAAVGKAVFA